MRRPPRSSRQAGQGLFDSFLYPNDYHNLKVALKNELLSDPREIFMTGGSIPVEVVREAVKNREFKPLTDLMGRGVEEAWRPTTAPGTPR